MISAKENIGSGGKEAQAAGGVKQSIRLSLSKFNQPALFNTLKITVCGQSGLEQVELARFY